MSKCKSPMCESDSLRNSEYCFEHYQKRTALMCREKAVKKVRGRASRVRSDRGSQIHICVGLLASYAFGLGQLRGKEHSAKSKAKAEVDKELGELGLYGGLRFGMALSMLMREKQREGDDGNV